MHTKVLLVFLGIVLILISTTDAKGGRSSGGGGRSSGSSSRSSSRSSSSRRGSTSSISHSGSHSYGDSHTATHSNSGGWFKGFFHRTSNQPIYINRSGSNSHHSPKENVPEANKDKKQNNEMHNPVTSTLSPTFGSTTEMNPYDFDSLFKTNLEVNELKNTLNSRIGMILNTPKKIETTGQKSPEVGVVVNNDASKNPGESTDYYKNLAAMIDRNLKLANLSI